MSSTDIQLIYFYIFNPTLTDKESAVSTDVCSLSKNIRIRICSLQEQQKQKVLFYYPKEDVLDRKLRNIGLCEAIINFTKSFSPSKPCEAVHTLKTRQVLLEAEPDIWMSMVRRDYNASIALRCAYFDSACRLSLDFKCSSIDSYKQPKGADSLGTN